MKLGLALCTYNRPEQVARWLRLVPTYPLEHFVISHAGGDLPKRADSEAVVGGENLGVAHTKNRGIRYLMDRGCDLLILAEDDCLITNPKLFDRLEEAARNGIHHLMLGPVTQHSTWAYTGTHKNIGNLTFYGYRRTRDPQDTPGVLTMVTREAVDRCGGLDGRFLGRGHAHGEWTKRIMREMPGPLPSAFWLLDSDDCIEYTDLPSQAEHDPEQVKRNEALRREGAPVPCLDYISTEPTEQPISVCMALMNRRDTLLHCLDSIAEWFANDRHPNQLIIADFGSTDCDPYEEMQERDIPGTVLRLDDYFSRARGLHRAQEVARHPLLLFLDADMLVPRHFGDMIRRYVSPGRALFPICWSLYRDGKRGWWRDTGYGMAAMTQDDYDRIGGWNLDRRRWGGEDNDLHWHAEQRLTVERACISGFHHQWHQDGSTYTEQYMEPDAESCRGTWRPPDMARDPIDTIRVPVSYLLPTLKEWGFHLSTVEQFEANPAIDADKTAYYKGVLDYKAKGGKLWPEIPAVGGEEKVKQRVEAFRRLYCSMRDEGYDEEQPIEVAIGKRGEIAVREGHHRAACAWGLGIESVPARVRSRAKAWVEFRDALYEQYRQEKLYTPIDHPDFAGWKVARDYHHRTVAIERALTKGTILDVGCCTGGIAVTFAGHGYPVTAVDKNKIALRAAQATERIFAPGGHPITWHAGDAFQANFGIHDWVLCLSVLHHVAKETHLRGHLEWLQRHARHGIFIEMADATETQMQGAGVPGTQEETGPWLAKLSGMKATPVLKGVPKEHRKSASDRRWIWLLR